MGAEVGAGLGLGPAAGVAAAAHQHQAHGNLPGAGFGQGSDADFGRTRAARTFWIWRGSTRSPGVLARRQSGSEKSLDGQSR